MPAPPKPAKKTVDVFKALAHPVRLQLLQAVADAEGGEASPKQLSDLLGDPLGNVSYHVKRLHDLGVLRETRTVPRRGAIEHFYTRTKQGDAALVLLDTAQRSV